MNGNPRLFSCRDENGPWLLELQSSLYVIKICCNNIIIKWQNVRFFGILYVEKKDMDY